MSLYISLTAGKSITKFNENYENNIQPHSPVHGPVGGTGNQHVVHLKKRCYLLTFRVPRF